MEKSKFPPRVYSSPDNYLDFFEWSNEPTGGEQYLSLTEHQAIVRELEEKLAEAQYDREAMAALWGESKARLQTQLFEAISFLKKIDAHTLQYSGVAGNQELFKLVNQALEKMGEI